MSTVYIETVTASDLNFNTLTAPANSVKLLQTAPGSGSSLTLTLASSASAVKHAFVSEPGDPGASGDNSAGWTLTYNITTANVNWAAGTATPQRINAAGVVQASGTAKTISFTSTGVKTATWLASEVTALGTWNSGDRFVMLWTLNNSAMSVQSIVIEVGLANGNEQVTTPWTITVPDRAGALKQMLIARQAVARSATWMKRRSGIVVPRLWTPADALVRI